MALATCRKAHWTTSISSHRSKENPRALNVEVFWTLHDSTVHWPQTLQQDCRLSFITCWLENFNACEELSMAQPASLAPNFSASGDRLTSHPTKWPLVPCPPTSSTPATPLKMSVFTLSSWLNRSGLTLAALQMPSLTFPLLPWIQQAAQSESGIDLPSWDTGDRQGQRWALKQWEGVPPLRHSKLQPDSASATSHPWRAFLPRGNRTPTSSLFFSDLWMKYCLLACAEFGLVPLCWVV